MTYPFKITIFLTIGLLFWVAGCSLTAPPKTEPSQSKVTPASTAQKVNQANTAVAKITPLLATAVPVATATVGPMPIPTANTLPYLFHIVQEGETLGYIASLYDTDLDKLVAMNHLAGADALIQIKQVLRIPLNPNISQAPVDSIWPDSEVVYSPAYLDFDIAKFINSQNGYLKRYTELVDGKELNGAEVVNQVAEQFSVGPRVLLALLEHYGKWVTNPSPSDEQLNYPMGPNNPRGNSLYLTMAYTAKIINAGYYGYKRDGFWIFKLADYTVAMTPRGMNAGTVGMENILAIHADAETWKQAMSADGLLADYVALFGKPASYAIKWVVPSNLTQPPLNLPWAEGKSFYFTSGPHYAYIEGTAWSALDFSPPDVLGSCNYSDVPNTAVADGKIVVSRTGEVELDLDGDGHIQTGWVILYLHVVLDVDNPLKLGQQVKQGDIIGYASCAGGEAVSSHLHFARRYNGEWLEAGGQVPFELSGWVVQPNLVPYEGTMKKGDKVHEACECWDKEKNLIVNEGTK